MPRVLSVSLMARLLYAVLVFSTESFVHRGDRWQISVAQCSRGPSYLSPYRSNRPRRLVAKSSAKFGPGSDDQIDDMDANSLRDAVRRVSAAKGERSKIELRANMEAERMQSKPR